MGIQPLTGQQLASGGLVPEKEHETFLWVEQKMQPVLGSLGLAD
jgi:hypothetical protein